MAILEKRGRHVTIVFVFSSLWVFRPKKNKLWIVMSVNLHAGNEVGPLVQTAFQYQLIILHSLRLNWRG